LRRAQDKFYSPQRRRDRRDGIGFDLVVRGHQIKKFLSLSGAMPKA
jgi:hypothetical protein